MRFRLDDRFRWCVLVTGSDHFVLPARMIQDGLERWRWPASFLSVVLRLDKMKPSLQMRRKSDWIELPALPAAGPARQAVILGKQKGVDVVRAIAVVGRNPKTARSRRSRIETWTTKESEVFRQKSLVTTAGLGAGGERGPSAGQFFGRERRHDPAKGATRDRRKRAVKRVKTSPRNPRRRQAIGRPAREAHQPPAAGSANRETNSQQLSSQFIDSVRVFYATDREPSIGKSLHYTNRLAAASRLSYGTCSVSVPENHKLGHLETPSIWRFQIREDPRRHFAILECTNAAEATFFRDVNQVLAKGEKAAFVFIHGYNVGFEDAIKRTAQLSRDMKFPGVPILYSWASAAAKRLYAKDEETVALTVQRLADFLEKLSKSSGAKELHLIAHSMGNRALINAITALQSRTRTKARRFKQVVLTAPDVPRQDAEQLIAVASQTAERITLYSSNKDKALLASKGLHANPRLGFVYSNFPYVVPGLDSIDASSVATDFLGHSFFSSTRTVLGDLSAVILDGKPPNQRFGLKQLRTPSGLCWRFA
jgi:esterase/lipase superfamily enzyme